MKNSAKQKGFSIVEAILSVALFGIVATIFTAGIIFSQESVVSITKQQQALTYAQSGLEIVRNMRDEAFDALSDGEYGLEIQSGVWDFSGTNDTWDIYTRTITISSIDADTKEVVADVTWQNNPRSLGSVSLATRLSNWQETQGALCADQASVMSIDTSSAFLAGGNRQLSDIFVSNSDAGCDVVIEAVTLTWTSASVSLGQLIIDNTNVWSGSESSGNQITIDQTAVEAGTSLDIQARFGGRVNGNTFTIELQMTDGTTVSSSSFTP